MAESSSGPHFHLHVHLHFPLRFTLRMLMKNIIKERGGWLIKWTRIHFTEYIYIRDDDE